MPTDYVFTIRRQDTVQIVSMLRALSAGRRIPGWSSGKAFEHVILRAFELEGAEVTWPFDVRIERQTLEQIDGAVYSDNLSCLVEAKDYADAINIEPVAKLRNQLSRRPPGTLGLIFARSGFTEPAKMLTRYITPLNILMWEYNELEAAVENRQMRQALQRKYRKAVEQGVPDYNYLEETL